jgi:hypothetical protein
MGLQGQLEVHHKPCFNFGYLTGVRSRGEVSQVDPGDWWCLCLGCIGASRLRLAGLVRLPHDLVTSC